MIFFVKLFFIEILSSIFQIYILLLDSKFDPLESFYVEIVDASFVSSKRKTFFMIELHMFYQCLRMITIKPLTNRLSFNYLALLTERKDYLMSEGSFHSVLT